MEYKLRNELYLSKEHIESIESTYNCRFICDTPIKGTNGWYDNPCALFYNYTAHPAGSNWMAFTINHLGEFVVTDGISAVEPDNTIDALLYDDGSLIYSSYRHDYVCYNGKCIDGGRDYTKVVYSSDDENKSHTVQLMITPDGLEYNGHLVKIL